MKPIVFVLLRLAAGASMFGHGLVRLPKLKGFSDWMVASFEKSMLPAQLVLPFSYILSIGELIVGILLLCGLFTRTALIAGAVLMIMLVFGSCMIESWDAIPSQLIHVAFFAVLLQYLPANAFALDRYRQK